jgi:hypothetical protein
MWVANHFEFFSKLIWTHPLTKLNTNKSCYVEKYLALVGMCMSLSLFSFNSDQSQNQGSARLTLTQISHLPTT